MSESLPKEILAVDKDKCTSCGICSEICPLGVITIKEDGIQQAPDSLSSLLQVVFETEKQYYCLGCGHCVAICPHDAISHAKSPLETSPLIQRELLPGIDQVEHMLTSRRSIRAFADRPVEREKLHKLIQIASYAPTGGNAQSIEWIVADDRGTLDKVRQMAIEWMSGLVRQNHELLRKAPIENTLEGIARGRDPILRNAPAMVIAKAGPDTVFREQDIDIALANLEIAAYAAGLGTTWLAMVTRVVQAYEPLRTMLGISYDDYYYAMLIGYPKYRFKRIPHRSAQTITFMKA